MSLPHKIILKKIIIVTYKHIKDNENTMLLENFNIKTNFYINLKLRLQRKIWRKFIPYVYNRALKISHNFQVDISVVLKKKYF